MNREDGRIEFKAEITNPKKHFIRPIIAFANTLGGTLHIGKDDSGVIVSNAKLPEPETMWNWINDIIHNDFVKIVSSLVEYKNRDGFIEILVSASSIAICDRDGEYFIRSGCTTRKVTKHVASTRAKEVIELNEEFDLKKYKTLLRENIEFSEKYKRIAYGIQIGENSTSLGKIFQDDAKNLKINNEDLLSSAIKLNEIIPIIIKGFNDKYIIGAKKISIEDVIPEYGTIIRELVANAIAHSSYGNMVTIRYEPGFLYVSNHADEQFIDMIRKGTIHHRPNNVLRHKLMKKIGFIEAEGQGFNKEILRGKAYTILFLYEDSEMHILFTPKINIEFKDDFISKKDIKKIDPLSIFVRSSGNTLILKEGVIKYE